MEEYEMTKKQIYKKAKEEGIKIRKNNVVRAKPLHKVCGNLKTLHPASIETLITGR